MAPERNLTQSAQSDGLYYLLFTVLLQAGEFSIFTAARWQKGGEGCFSTVEGQWAQLGWMGCLHP